MAHERDVAARRSALSPAKRALLEQRLRAGAARTGQPAGIPRRDVDGPAPLSFAQQRLWFLDQLAPGNPFYNIPAAIPLSFRLDVEVLRRCLNEIVRRHATLRTTFTVENGEPLQQVAPDLAIPLPVIDLRHLPPPSRDDEVLRLATEEGLRPFDISRGPLLRSTLLCTAEDEHILLLTMHHIISDGWSMGVLFREMIALYGALARGLPSPLAPLPIQYADFAVWQREWLQGDTLQKQLDYWRAKLAGLPTLRLPTDRPRPAAASFRGAYHDWRVSAPLTRAIAALAAAHRGTPFMVLLAAFKVLLNRYTGQSDVVVGAPIANRNRAEVEPLIGFFVNNLVLRTDLSGDPTFAEVIERVRDVTLEAYAHQDLPFEKLVEELQPERDLSRNPLCQVTLQIQNAPGATDDTPTGERSGPEIKRGTSIFDIACSVWETTDGLIGGFEYSTDLFDEATIEQLARHFTAVLTAVVADPGLRMSEIPLLSAEERRRIVVDWNATERPFAPDLLLHELFEEQARRTPGATAVDCRGERTSYRELNDRADALAARLREPGMERDAVVGVCCERSLAMVVAMIAVLKSGAAYLPLDPALPPQRLALIARDAGVRLILTEGRWAGRLQGTGASTLDLDAPVGPRQGRDGPAAASHADAESLAYVLYTSGSTGRPKGVMVPHRAICNHMQWMLSEGLVGPRDRVLQRTPFTFDASVWEFWAPLLCGGELVMLPPTHAADVEAVVAAISARRVTVLQLVPSLLRMLLDDPGFGACRSLRRVFCGGEELPPELRDRFLAEHDAELYNLYGPTEATIDSLSWHCERGDARPTVPLGRPIANSQVYILDSGMRPVPPGVAGEIWIGGRGVARGYRGRHDLTAERFLPDPFLQKPGGRLYRTGDLGRWHRDGVVEFLGRVDTQVKLRGYRIELGEIDAALAEHAAVREAITLLREDAAGDQRLVAYAALDPAFHPEERSAVTRLHEERLEQWRSVFDEIYAPALQSDPATPDFTGWNSSYTGEPLPAAEMRAWLSHTVDRIRALRPSRVVEIGCGTGLLLFELAPHCTRYVGLDLSSTVLEKLRARMAASAMDLRHVHLLNTTADDLGGVEPGAFDLVILNSVVQYFPSVDYLVQVLKEALRRLAPGGFLFLGDLYSLPLQEALHTSIELWRAPDEMPLEELRERVRRRGAQAKELALDPAFFGALRRVFPEISGVWVTPKRGDEVNEMTCFRYDVTLQVRGAPPASGHAWIDWQRSRSTGESVLRTLHADRPEVLGVSRVPDPRVGPHLEAARLTEDRWALSSVGELRRELSAAPPGGATPEWWVEPARRLGYDVELRWLRGASDGTVDLLFRRRDSRIPRWAVGPAAETSAVAGARESTLRHYGNNPLQGMVSGWAVPALQAHLAERLPDYMVPSAILLLDRLPLLSNGKVDRAALPAPNFVPGNAHGSYVAPRNPVEEVLASLWSEILRVPRVGVHDNFFTDLGGHSLLATQLASSIRETFRSELPLRVVFERPTVAGLAEHLLALPEVGARVGRLAELLLQVEKMTDEEVATLATAGTATL